MSDKRLLGNCGDSKSNLVDSGTISFLPKEGAKEEPKYEPNGLKTIGSFNHSKRGKMFFIDWVIKAEDKYLEKSFRCHTAWLLKETLKNHIA